MNQLELPLDMQTDAYYDFTATVKLFGAKRVLGWPCRYRDRLTEQEEAKELEYHSNKLNAFLQQQGEVLSSGLREVGVLYIDATQEIPGMYMPYCHEDTHI